MEGMYTQATSPADDPESIHEPSEREEEVVEVEVSSGGDARVNN